LYLNNNSPIRYLTGTYTGSTNMLSETSKGQGLGLGKELFLSQGLEVV